MQALPVLDPKAAGIDVGSETIHVSIAGDTPNVFGTTTGQIHALRDWLQERGVHSAAMEATEVYWLCACDVLEAAGLEVLVVNGKHVKNLPGRKTEAENIELLKQYIRDKEATFHLQFEKDKVLDEVLLKNGFMLDYTLTPQPDFKKNEVLLAKDAHKKSLVCLDAKLEPETVDHFKTHKDQFFICLELALDTTKKWNLKHSLGEKLKAI